MGIFLKRKYFFNLNNNVLFFQFECYFLRQYDKAIVTRPLGNIQLSNSQIKTVENEIRLIYT